MARIPLPFRDAAFTLDAFIWPLEDCTMEFDGDLADVSTNLSGGADELADCWARASVSGSAPLFANSTPLLWGATYMFTGTLVTGIVILWFVKIAKIRVTGKVKDVWRVSVDAKSTAPVQVLLPTLGAPPLV